MTGAGVAGQTVCPGFVETRWLQEAIGEKYEKARPRFAGNSALQKTSTPADIADVALWLLTGGPTITGELILADGGNRLGAFPR